MCWRQKLVELRAGIGTDQAVNQTGHDVESRIVGPWLSLATLTEIDIPPDTSFYSVCAPFLLRIIQAYVRL